jgi:hypothetical protein
MPERLRGASFEKPGIVIAPLLLAALLLPAQTQTSTPGNGWTGPPVVQDAPYFAGIISTYQRTLPNGEHLNREINSKIYRDTQGRTRRETEQMYPSTGKSWVGVLINDPVSNAVISLDSRTMTARVRDGSAAALKPSARPKQDTPLESPSSPPATGQSPVSTSESKLEELGTQVMEGLTVHGTKTTIALPPSTEGAGQPRTIVVTRWVSDELHIDVLTETDDQQGHRAVRLVNIVRTEPDADLFKIPSGYTVVTTDPPAER